VRAPNRHSQGFTLLEMMITVAIIGILAAIAIPAFQNYQSRSKRAEAFANLAAIRDVEKSYFSEYNAFVKVAGSWPGPPLGPNKRQWTALSDAAFGKLGWRPEGAVYYDYSADIDLAACPAQDCFTAAAYGDADSDGVLAIIEYVQPSGTGATSADAILGLGPPINPVTGNPMINEVAQNFAGGLY
jgi:prepilin-type N-terminal cleavage/methylation domain-containing protein